MLVKTENNEIQPNRICRFHCKQILAFLTIIIRILALPSEWREMTLSSISSTSSSFDRRVTGELAICQNQSFIRHILKMSSKSVLRFIAFQILITPTLTLRLRASLEIVSSSVRQFVRPIDHALRYVDFLHTLRRRIGPLVVWQADSSFPHMDVRAMHRHIYPNEKQQARCQVSRALGIRRDGADDLLS
jgi:hypothetical protein